MNIVDVTHRETYNNFIQAPNEGETLSLFPPFTQFHRRPGHADIQKKILSTSTVSIIYVQEII